MKNVMFSRKTKAAMVRAKPTSSYTATINRNIPSTTFAMLLM